MITARPVARVCAGAILAVLALAPVHGQPPAAAKPGSNATGREAGDAQAQFRRGLALLCQTEQPTDPGEVARRMQSAAEQGHVAAQSVLGWMYLSGKNAPQDDAQAAPWLRKAAEKGDAAAQNNLGVLYAIGQGVPHDHAQARHWFQAAAKQGAADARRNLAELDRPDAGGGEARRVSFAASSHPLVSRANCRAGTARPRKLT